MIDIFIVLFAFSGGFFLVYGANLLVTDVFVTDRKEMKLRMREDMLAQQREEARQSPLVQHRDLSDMAAEALDEAAEEKGLGDRLQEMIDQAGIRTSSERVLLIMVGLGLLGALVVGLPLQSPVAAIIGGAILIPLPVVYVQFYRHRRLEAMRAQLPDCFDLMSRVMRAGQTITQAMQSVAEELPQPVAGEFGYCHEQQNLGLSPELAFRDLARRTGLVEIRVFVLAMLVHRQTGGNLAELLEKLGEIVRDRFRMRSKVKALTAEGQFQAIILLCLPILAFLAMLALNPSYGMKLFNYPNMLIGGAISMCIGSLWIRKIINFDF